MSLPIAPIHGRIARRQFADGFAIVGLLQWPKEQKIEEGRAYLLVWDGTHMNLMPEPVDNEDNRANFEQHMFCDLDGMLRAQLWNKTTTPLAFVVRFFEAFPQSNEWVVFGPSAHEVPFKHPTTPSEKDQWWDIAKGISVGITSPVATFGETMGQLLTQHVVWPDRGGNSFSLPHTHSVYRRHQYALNQQLALAVRHPQLWDKVHDTLSANVFWQKIGVGRSDKEFALFLSSLDDQGQLDIDGPRTIEQKRARSAAADIALAWAKEQTINALLSAKALSKSAAL